MAGNGDEKLLERLPERLLCSEVFGSWFRNYPIQKCPDKCNEDGLRMWDVTCKGSLPKRRKNVKRGDTVPFG